MPKRYLGMLAALLLCFLFYVVNPFGVSIAANKVLSVAVLMVVLWVSEALPMAAVALFPGFPYDTSSTVTPGPSANSPEMNPMLQR